uniref:outer membrane beta-barrel protein n=1 Tax=Flavobacterium sp. TaxID=239 RepID=UPI0040493650
MPKSNFISFLLLFISVNFYAQQIVVKGKIIDKTTQTPLESATVYLATQKDSAVFDYTISDRNGNFEIKTYKKNQAVQFKISFLGYENYIQNFENLVESIDLQTIQLNESSNALSEVIVESEIPPVRIKNDTLEFNANSFKVLPDSNVQSLLKQLPGVEIDEEGKIKVNGREVNQILVNGKPFFDKDGKVALQNLPADIIDKIQVSDSKTKSEELSGQNASSNDASINLTIEEDKNQGYFGKIMGGFGTDDRYESSAMINYFKGERKISLIASSNNINSSGFSMDEIFDSMGGGRNVSTWGDGSFAVNGVRFGGGDGITTTNLVGLNYSDQFYEKLETTGSYFYTNASSENTNRTQQTVFLPDVNYEENSTSISKADNYGHNFNANFEAKIDSTFSIYFEPRFSKSNGKNRNTNQQISIAENGETLNQSESESFTENDSDSFNSNLYITKAFTKKGRFTSLYSNISIDKNTSDSFLEAQNQFFENNEVASEDNRNQLVSNNGKSNQLSVGAEYFEPITDSLSFKFGVNYDRDRDEDDRIANDFDDLTNGFTQENQLLSNFLASKTQSIEPRIGLQINKEKLNATFNFGPSFTSFQNESFYLGNQTTLEKNYVLPSADFYVSYRMSKSKSIYTYYNYQIDFPSANQILPVENLSNPLNTVVGNPDLEPNKSHYGYLSFRNYDFTSKSGYSIYAGGNYYDTRVLTATLFDETRKRFTTYVNLEDTYYFWFGGNWNKTVKKEAHTFKATLSLNGNFNKNKGITNDELYVAEGIGLTPKLNLSWEYGELLSLSPSYSFRYSETNYKNYVLSNASNTLHTFNLQSTVYWPKNIVFGNDFGYTYNSNIADGFKKDFYLWNMSLGYQMFNKKLLAKVKVYDLLDQNISNTRTITSSGIRDEENTVLRRYAMFSLTFKIDKFGGKK